MSHADIAVPALERWLADHVAGFEGPLTVERFSGGQSNPTYRLDTPGRSYVLRRQPSGQLFKGAHAVDREARVIGALAQAGYPVAPVHALCTDRGVIGSWFIVQSLVEGRVFWNARLPDVPREKRAACYLAMARTHAALHAIDPAAVGLQDYGRPGNYVGRQIARWTSQYLADEEAGRDAAMDRLIAWLPGAVPASAEAGAAIIHGDYRIDNMIFDPAESRILAVIDWELSTLGHPLADFVYGAMTYQMPPHIVAGLAGADLGALGIPDEQAYVAAYCAAAGLDEVPDYSFYMAFNFFRIAAIFHGIKGRHLRGAASSAHAAERARLFPELAALAWEKAMQAGAKE
nr:phosphotransferase [uncultured Sphingomonas sp.]